MHKYYKDFWLRSCIIGIVIILHLFIFIYRSSSVDFGWHSSFSSLKTIPYAKNEYYKKFGNKKFKIILTNISGLKADFILKKNKLQDKNKEKENLKQTKLLESLEKTSVVKQDNSFVKKDINKNKLETQGEDKIVNKDANGYGGNSAYGKDKLENGFTQASHVGGYLRNPLPPYPVISRQNNEQGTVVLEVVVEPDGNPSKVSIIKSSGYSRLDKSAQITVEQKYKFIPASRLGITLRSRYRFSINFSLN